MEQGFDRPVSAEHEQPCRITTTGHIASHSSVALSLQCRSSRTRTSGSATVKHLEGFGELAKHPFGAHGCGRFVPIRRPAPADARANSAHNLGAQDRVAMPGSRPSRPSASRIGRYGSPAPNCSMHCPRAIRTTAAAAICGDERFHEGGLPDAGFAGMNPMRRVPAGRRRTTCAQRVRLGLAPDEDPFPASRALRQVRRARASEPAAGVSHARRIDRLLRRRGAMNL